jgi:hypothetical protein
MDTRSMAIMAEPFLQNEGAGQVLPVFSSAEKRWVLTVLTRDPQDFALQLPPPPGAEVPAVIHLVLSVRRGFSLEIEAPGRSLRYICGDAGATPPNIAVALEPAVCNGERAEVRLMPRQYLSGPLSVWRLRGEFTLTALQLETAPVGPQ